MKQAQKKYNMTELAKKRKINGESSEIRHSGIIDRRRLLLVGN